MQTPPSELRVRCFCIKKTLLAVSGRDQGTGEPFLHIKVHKQGRIMANFVALSGVVRLQCRDCGRWHKITLRPSTPEIVTEALPESIAIG